MSFTADKLTQIATNYRDIHKSHGIALLGDEWAMIHNGTVIINIDNLRLLDFTRTDCDSLENEEMKEKMIAWVYDSRNLNAADKRKFIFEKMKKMFPSAHLLVSIRSTKNRSSWSISGHKAFAIFRDYGDFDVITCFF